MTSRSNRTGGNTTPTNSTPRAGAPRQGRRAALAALAGSLFIAAGTAGLAAGAQAQEYPSRQPVRLIVPYPAGGGTDYFARAVSEKMGESLGQRVIVDNRPGAATIIGAEAVVNAPADGYTVLLGDNATYAVNPALYKSLSYDPLNDLLPVTLTARFALLLVTHPSVPVESVNGFIAMAREKPGKLDFGSPGTGSPHHLAMELFEQRAGVDLMHIPYKGGAPATQDLLAGLTTAMFLDLPTAVPHIKAGKLKVLAVASDKRLSSMPEVPTVSEAANLPGYEAWAWQGFSVPKGTPDDVITRLNAAFAKAAADEEVQRKMEGVGTDLIPSTPQEMADYVKSESVKWAEAIRKAGIKVE